MTQARGRDCSVMVNSKACRYRSAGFAAVRRASGKPDTRTERDYPESDLDLLILINDDRGWQLGKAFIQEDPGVGHDIYCTSWESLNEMLNDISSETDIGTYDALSAYDTGDLRKTADGFDRILRRYLQEYERAGLYPARYADVGEFISAYLKKK